MELIWQMCFHENRIIPSKKYTVLPFQIDIPRDRAGEFTPQPISKGVRKFKGFDDKVIALYGRGMTMSKIQSYIEEIYHTEISKDLISTITDSAIDEATRW